MSLVSSFPDIYLEDYEGEELRRNVLIRNAVKAASIRTAPSARRIASTSASDSSFVGGAELSESTDSAKERWTFMASRAGLHPSDYLEESDEDEDEEDDAIESVQDEEEIPCGDSFACSEQQGERVPRQESLRIDVYDYSSDDTDDESGDEGLWFDGLLQEVRAEPGFGTASIDDAPRNALSSSLSLPSLIIDDGDDEGYSSEEQGREEVDERPIGSYPAQAAAASKLPSTEHLLPRHLPSRPNPTVLLSQH